MNFSYKKEYHQARYLRDKEKMDAQSSAWRLNNRERYNELQRRWRKEHPDKVKEHTFKNNIWRSSHPENVKRTSAKSYLKYYPKYRHQISKKSAQRYKNSPEVRQRIKEQSKIWSKNNPEKVAAKARRWRLKNKDKVRMYAGPATQKRRALKRGNTVNPKSILIFIRGVKAKAFTICYYCRKRVSTKRINFDHMTPLSKGGPHSVENLCVSCERCNQTKHTKLLREFVTLGQRLLEL